MLTTEFSIPVSVKISVSDVLHGIFEIEGLLSYADEALTIEYQPKELHARPVKVETIHLSLDSLREVDFKRRIVGATITVRTKWLTAFEDVPIAKNAQLVLKVKRADRKRAKAFVSHLQRVMAYRSAPDSLDPIPFRGPAVGLREIRGEMYLEHDEFLVFEVQNALLGSFDVERHVIKVSPRALQDVRLGGRRFRDRLFVRPKRRNLLDAMPGSYEVELELRIKRKHRDQVERLIYELARLSRRDSRAAGERAGGADRG